MRHRPSLSLIAATGALTVLATTFVLEGEASACGGCFGPPPPPTETPTVVTDHRMILTVSKEQSTLYDQIRYQGSPQSFAWVLPIAGTVEVGLSADKVFSGLDTVTQTQLVAPPLNCPPPPNCNARGGSSGSSGGASGGAAAPEDPGVNVIKKEVVGPYETVQLEATNPTALHDWLAKNGFVVPPEVKPVIDTYVAEKFNFLALKLVPGKGVQDMRPVRVTTKGASATLPLRMVAAGTGANVGISLWTLGEGRYEPQNFPSFVIQTDEIVWDWPSSKSNYIELRAAKTQAGGGKAWEVESSSILYRQTLESIVNSVSYNGEGPYPTNDEERAQLDYLPVKDGQGNIVKTAAQVRTEDMDTLFYGIPTATSRVTRLRADLAKAALASDLVMTASKDQAVLSNVRQITKENGQPLCPVYNGCNQVDQVPRDQAIARATPAGDETFACSTSRSGPSTWLAASLGFAGLALTHAIRRFRRENGHGDRR
jgi:uncharacterized protein DUF2330